MDTPDPVKAEEAEPTPTDQNKEGASTPNNRVRKIFAALFGLVVVILIVVLSVALSGNKGQEEVEVPVSLDFTTGELNLCSQFLTRSDVSDMSLRFQECL